jgi:hypothetical protein
MCLWKHYLYTYEGKELFDCLVVCLLHWDLPNHNTCCSILNTLGESPLMSRGVHWVGYTMFQPTAEKFIEYWTILFSLKIQLNQKINFMTEFGHALDFVRKPLMSKDLIKVICKFSDLRCGGSCSNHLHILRFKVQTSLVSHINPTPIQQTNTFKRDLLLIRFLSLPF